MVFYKLIEEFFVKYLGLSIPENVTNQNSLNLTEIDQLKIPDSFDWREKNILPILKFMTKVIVILHAKVAGHLVLYLHWKLYIKLKKMYLLNYQLKI